MKRFLYCLVLCCLFFSVGFGQGLQVGDQVPDVVVRGVTGMKSADGRDHSSVRLVSDFKGKLLLLDFWATWCAPCRAMMPRLDSLQGVFGDRLVVLPVAYERAAVVQPMLQAMKRTANISLPMLTGDTTLVKLFPHRALPHEVWLLDGRVLAITEDNAVTGENIRLALAGSLPVLPVKRDLRAAYDKTLPLLVNGNGGSASALAYHSVLSGYMPGLPAGMDVTEVNSVHGQRFTLRNAPFLWLARLAYADSGRWFPDARIRLLSRDSSRLNTNLAGMAYHNWLAAGNGWCYELLVPPRLSGSAGYALVRQDMARLFPHYRVRVEKHTVRSLVLVRTSGMDKLQSKSAGGYSVNIGPYAAHIRGGHLRDLLMRLERQFMQDSKLPLADGTGYDGLVDLDLEVSLADIGALNAALKAYDLTFVKREFPADLLMITDN